MNNQSTINNTSPALLSLANAYGQTLNALSDRLLPDGYRFSLTRVTGKDTRRYGIEATGPDGTDFTFPIADAPDVQSITLAAETLQKTLWAVNDAKADHAHRMEHARADWHSRYEGVEHPRLALAHDPGFTLVDVSMNSVEVVHRLFSTEFEPLGLGFDVYETDGEPVSISFGGEIDWNIHHANDLLELAKRTGELTQWLHDCALVTAWATDNDTMEAR